VFERRRIARTRSGEIRVRLAREERALVRAVVEGVRRRLDDDPEDRALRRLFPPAYADDVEAEGEYRDLVRDSLVESRRHALQLVDETLDRERLSVDEAEAWLGALNDVRLVLGTLLDVTEDTYAMQLDEANPRDRELAVFAYLSWLQEQLVEALASSVD
jgi:Domain of unknown function (DUF2017)